jgi:hypothetical protein
MGMRLTSLRFCRYLKVSKGSIRAHVEDKVLTFSGVLLLERLRSVWGSPGRLLGGGGRVAFSAVLDTILPIHSNVSTHRSRHLRGSDWSLWTKQLIAALGKGKEEGKRIGMGAYLLLLLLLLLLVLVLVF